MPTRGPKTYAHTEPSKQIEPLTVLAGALHDVPDKELQEAPETPTTFGLYATVMCDRERGESY